jgi:hypothetical protein
MRPNCLSAGNLYLRISTKAPSKGLRIGMVNLGQRVRGYQSSPKPPLDAGVGILD